MVAVLLPFATSGSVGNRSFEFNASKFPKSKSSKPAEGTDEKRSSVDVEGSSRA